MQQGQQVAGQQELGVDVDLHNFLPAGIGGTFDRASFPQHAGIVQQAIEAPKVRSRLSARLRSFLRCRAARSISKIAACGPPAVSISSYTASSLLPVRPSKTTVAPWLA